MNLLGSLFELGTASDRRRRELAEDFAALFTRIDAAAYLDSAIEFFDSVLTFAASDPAPRDIPLSTVLAAVQRWRRRVRPDQWLIVQDLAAEVGAEEALRALVPEATAEASADPLPDRQTLSGKTVAIYSLTESPWRGHADFLVRNFDGVSVVTSSEHVASDRLANLARTADVFVIATLAPSMPPQTSSNLIRPPNRPPLYAAGKGSVSLLRGVLGSSLT